MSAASLNSVHHEGKPIPGVSIAVMVPCCNEAGTIADCVRQLLQVDGIHKILVVDDGSQDGSGEICTALATLHPTVETLLLPQNVGKNAALRAGARTISEDLIIILDADMTVAPDCIRSVLAALRLRPLIFAYGSRFTGKMKPGAMSLTHRVGNRFFAEWMSLLLNCKIGDVLCGFKAIPTAVMTKMPQSACRWGDFDLFFAASEAGLPFVEIPVAYAPRRAGKSKMRAVSSGLYFAYLCAERTLRGLLRTSPRKALAAR